MLDAENRTTYVDLCANEAVHTIGRIQAHGLLLALSEPDLILRHVSANVSDLLGTSPGLLLGRSLEAVFGAAQYVSFRSRLLRAGPITADPFRLVPVGCAYEMECVAHRQDGVLLLELELLQGTHTVTPLKLDAHIGGPVALMEQARDLAELAQHAAGEVRRLSGFDRVMVYRFDEEWNGEVVAETTAPSPVSYLGLHFPASDIPAQVRRLFLINPLRAIADIDATPVPIVPDVSPLTGRLLDLTRSSLRAASPVHIEYLRNMGVQSSLTVSILVKEQLWGMIACHHATPHRLDCSTRSLCGLIGQIMGSQVTLRLDNAALQARLASRKGVANFMTSLEASASRGEPLSFQKPELLEACDADGLICSLGGVVSSFGASVEERLLLPVVDKLRNHAVRGLASSNMLSSLHHDAALYANQASGALYLELSEVGGDYLLLLRRELVETVNWAGNPDKAVSANERGELRPRASFAAWQQTVSGRSRPWNELELEAAALVREHLLRLIEEQKLREAQERVRYLAHHDTLTGLLNRHSIQIRLEQFIEQAAARQAPLALLFIDLDHFKHYNDSLGHAVGDAILQAIANRMQNHVRTGDLVGRLGGDEFIVILPDPLRHTDLQEIVGRLLRALEEPLKINDHSPINITASIGVSRFPIDGTSSDSLVSSSDTAMYHVKRNGGNAFQLFEAG